MGRKTAVYALLTAFAGSSVSGIALSSPANVLAVTGVQVAEDGSYSAPVTVEKYKKGKYDKSYYGTVYVQVSDGKISGLTIYSSDKQDRFSELLNNVRSSYVGQPATVSGVSAAVDAVSSPTAKGASGSSSDKYYTSNLTDAIENAIKSAPAKAGGTQEDEGDAAADGIYTGTAKMSDNDHFITLDVTVRDGVITDIAINAADGSWDELLSQVKDSYIGSPAKSSNVDAVTGATSKGYRQAIANAIKNALGSAPSEEQQEGYGIIKRLKKAVRGVETPDATFTFTLTPKDGAPAISAKTISVSGDTDLSSLKADIALSEDDMKGFTDAGVYEYILTEEEGGLSSSARGDMSYNTGSKSYLVRYKLWYNADVKLEPAAITVHEIINGVVADEKTETPEFENCYTVMSEFSVSKRVEGEHADKSKSFEYTVSFTKDAANEGLKLTADTALKKGSDEISPGNALEYDTQYTFELTDSETVIFYIPAGTDYELTESAADNYTPEVNVTADGRQAAQSGKTGESFTLKAYVGEKENKADFTNTYVDNPLTGLTGSVTPFVVILAIAGGGVATVVLLKKKKRVR